MCPAQLTTPIAYTRDPLAGIDTDLIVVPWFEGDHRPLSPISMRRVEAKSLEPSARRNFNRNCTNCSSHRPRIEVARATDCAHRRRAAPISGDVLRKSRRPPA
jgi:hypothetical protein